MFVGNIRKNKKLNGYVEKGLVETNNIRSRHKQLSLEMKRRGFKHKSPLPSFNVKKAGKIDVLENIRELKKRCKKCRELIKSHKT
jgi:hypothetical protein